MTNFLSFLGDTNVSYVCSRPYRAPELVLGKEEYSVEVDWWSAGCVIAEIVLHRPLFCSSRGPSQQIKARVTTRDTSKINF